MNCEHKHTKYQVPDEEWKCPKCGVTANQTEGFFLDDPVTTDCDMLHDEDYLRCYACGYDDTGKKFAAKISKKKNLVKCECCNGKGYVEKKVSDEAPGS